MDPIVREAPEGVQIQTIEEMEAVEEAEEQEETTPIIADEAIEAEGKEIEVVIVATEMSARKEEE